MFLDELVTLLLIEVCLRLWLLDGTETDPDELVLPRREELAPSNLYPRLVLVVLLLMMVPRLVRTPVTEPFEEEVAVPTVRRPAVEFDDEVPTVALRPLEEEALDEMKLPPLRLG